MRDPLVVHTSHMDNVANVIYGVPKEDQITGGAAVTDPGAAGGSEDRTREAGGVAPIEAGGVAAEGHAGGQVSVVSGVGIGAGGAVADELEGLELPPRIELDKALRGGGEGAGSCSSGDV